MVTKDNSKRKHEISTDPVLSLVNFMLYILRFILELIRGKVSILNDFYEHTVIKRKVIMEFLNMVSLTLWAVGIPFECGFLALAPPLHTMPPLALQVFCAEGRSGGRAHPPSSPDLDRLVRV